MSDRSIANSPGLFSSTIAARPAAARPVAARTRLPNAVRLLASAGCALVAITWLDLGTTGFFVAIASGFCAYAALTAAAMCSAKEPSAPPMK